jgi:hypothetical protein
MSAFRFDRTSTSRLWSAALAAVLTLVPLATAAANRHAPSPVPSASVRPSLRMAFTPPQLPACLQAEAQLQTKLDTSVNQAGDSFAFTILESIPTAGTLPAIPAGTKGYGVVLYVQHAGGAGLPGTMILDPRFIELEDGTRVPVIADPAVQTSLLGKGSSGDAPGALEYVPFVGIAFSGYNSLHHGKEFVAAKGSRFKVVVGDDLATASCYVAPQPVP